MATATSETAHNLDGTAVSTVNPDATSATSVQSLQMKSVEMAGNF